MPIRKRPRGFGERVAVSNRVRGLHSVMGDDNDERYLRQDLFNKLAKLRMEKGRATQERNNWREKLEMIEQRLADIGSEETLLEHRLLTLLGCNPSHGKPALTGRRPARTDGSAGESQELVLHY